MRFYQPAICSTQKEKEKKIERSNLLGPDVIFALQDPSNLLWFIIGTGAPPGLSEDGCPVQKFHPFSENDTNLEGLDLNF